MEGADGACLKAQAMAITEIGSYQVVEEVGRGGMAVVYRAVEPDSGQIVAIKLMAGELTGDLSFRRRFQREADVLQRLRHPAIVPVLGHGEHGGQPYLVMPYLQGGTLADRLAGGPRPPGEVALLARIAGALDSAHRQGAIHRDVKPTNVLFDAAGRPYLADFGIVKLLDDVHTAVTQTGASLGTPGYMSPEQVRGLPLDGRCDIYALGVVLFEMLTGRLPFTATNPYAQAFQHVSDPVPVARSINPALAPGWQPILERALAKERTNRYPTAWAIIQAAGDLIDLSAPPRPGAAAVQPAVVPPPDAVSPLPDAPTAPAATVAPPRPAAARPSAGGGARVAAIALLVLAGTLALAGGAWLVTRSLGAPPEATVTATSTPSATLAAGPAATPIPGLPALRLSRDVDLRGGPGEAYPLVGQIAAGAEVTVVGRDAAGTWYNVQLGDGRAWLPRDAGDLLDDAGATRIPVASTIPPTATSPTETPALTATPPPTATRTPTPPPSPTATRPRPTATNAPLPATAVPPPPPTSPPPTDEPEPEPQPTDVPPPTDIPPPTADIPPTDNP